LKFGCANCSDCLREKLEEVPVDKNYRRSSKAVQYQSPLLQYWIQTTFLLNDELQIDLPLEEESWREIRRANSSVKSFLNNTRVRIIEKG
jgi:hypothetical protein